MSEATRKAVVTTEQVQAAVNRYETVKANISGLPAEGLLFDKGNRGKGFALYNTKDEAVQTFETKEAAYVQFTNWSKVADEVVALIAERGIREQAEADAKKTTRKPAEKPAA